MYPDLFTIPLPWLGEKVIHTYGFMVALAFLAGLIVSTRLARRTAVKPEWVYDVIVYIVVAAILGSRLFYIAAHLEEYSKDWRQLLDFSQGGLTFMGGVAGGAAAVILYARKKSIPLWPLGDVCMPSLALGAAIGRLGCFFNGCCYGFETAAPWGVVFPVLGDNMLRHPTQLYDFLSNMGIFGFLLWFYSRRKYDGQLVVAWMLIYPFTRSLMEFFREGASAKLIGPITQGQWASVAIFAGGLLLHWALTRKGKTLMPPLPGETPPPAKPNTG